MSTNVTILVIVLAVLAVLALAAVVLAALIIVGGYQKANEITALLQEIVQSVRLSPSDSEDAD